MKLIPILALAALTAGPSLAQSPALPADAAQPAAADAPPGGRPAADSPAGAAPAQGVRADGLQDGGGDAPRRLTAPDPLPGLAGPYLAARQAAGNDDFAAAARYFGEAIAKRPDDPLLQDSALVSLVSAGRTDDAAALAQKLVAGGRRTDMAALIDRVRLAREGDWAGLIASLGRMPSARQGGGELLDGMIRGWSLLGEGKASQAFAEFERLAKLKGAGSVARFHLALAHASTGDYEGAERILRQPDVAATHLLGVRARAEVLSQLERNGEALKLFEGLDNVEQEPGLADLQRRLQAGERLPFDAIGGPADGVAQVLMTFAGALAGGEDPDPLALMYARLAAWLSPKSADAHLLSAQLLQAAGQFDLAEPEFDALKTLGEMRPVAELARIDALARADRLDDAEQAARALTVARPDLAAAWVALGDLLRQRSRFADAVPAYDKAIGLLEKSGGGQNSWFALYARGIALERSGQFDRADADLQAALKLQPQQATILNYLGYSWVDRNVNLDQAVKLIEQAVSLRPEDGYILDSQAWAYYRLGRYQDAVAPMEKAVAAMSEDSLVNDHMGDVYWMAGRKREAEIQWRRALSLYQPDDADTDVNRIRAKLEVGLDAVRAAEKENGGKLPAGFGQPAAPPAAPPDAASAKGEGVPGQPPADQPEPGGAAPAKP